MAAAPAAAVASQSGAMPAVDVNPGTEKRLKRKQDRDAGSRTRLRLRLPEKLRLSTELQK